MDADGEAVVMRREETACGDSGGQNHKTNIDAGIIITLKAQGRHSKAMGSKEVCLIISNFLRDPPGCSTGTDVLWSF